MSAANIAGRPASLVPEYEEIEREIRIRPGAGTLAFAWTGALLFVVSLAAVRIGAIDLGIGNVLGSNLFNLLILGLDDAFYRQGPLLTAADSSHAIAVLAVVTMNALFLIGLTYRVMTKRFAVAWDTGAMAAVYVTAVSLAYLLRG